METSQKSQELQVHRKLVRLVPDDRRVITRFFLPGGERRLGSIFERLVTIGDAEADALLAEVRRKFQGRHRDVEAEFLANFEEAARLAGRDDELPEARRLLIGSYFTREYALESAALYNPSIVPHPDQSGVESGAVRFVMSLRACGEGHISSIVFRTGSISATNEIHLEQPASFATPVPAVEDGVYEKKPYLAKLDELGAYNEVSAKVLAELGTNFTLAELRRVIEEQQRGEAGEKASVVETFRYMLWLAHSRFYLDFPEGIPLQERVIFPVADHESRGIEDARFVRFTDGDGSQKYYATYTAYNGFRILPQLIETTDFRRFRITTLRGRCAQNKGFALFPRKVGGKYQMLSRIDGENIYLMTSDDLHTWNEAGKVAGPSAPWEAMLIGNCGSPIETEEGWLLLTHGVGPMRQYCIGAMLLDHASPARVVARLREPLLMPDEWERGGFVPNVVYSCGGMIHNEELILPFGISDRSTGIVTIGIPGLMRRLLEQRVS